MVRKLFSGGENTIARLRPQEPGLRQCTGDRGDRDAGALRYVVDRRRHRIVVGSAGILAGVESVEKNYKAVGGNRLDAPISRWHFL